MRGDVSSPPPPPPLKTRPGEGRRPFLAGLARWMIDTAIGMLIVLCGVGFVGRHYGWTLDVKVGWMFAATVALAVGGFTLAIIGAVFAGRKRGGGDA